MVRSHRAPNISILICIPPHHDTPFLTAALPLLHDDAIGNVLQQTYNPVLLPPCHALRKDEVLI